MQRQVSLKVIIDRLMRYPAMNELDFEAAVAWAVDAINLIGTVNMFKDAVDTLEISEYKAKLPEDFIKIKTARKFELIGGEMQNFIPLNNSTDPYHVDYKNLPLAYKNKLSNYTYNIQGDYMFTSFDEGYVQIAYSSIYLDTEGMLMIPENSSIIKAVESYIKQEYFRGLNEIGKLPDKVLNKAEQDWCWYVGQAGTSSLLMSLDERQSFSNVVNRLVVNDDYHSESFQDLYNQELIRVHR